MWIPCKFKTAAAHIKRGTLKVRQSVSSAAGWIGCGWIATKIKSAGQSIHDTFVQSTHGGYIDKGLVRVDEREKSVYISDIDGSDMAESFKKYVSKLTQEYSDTSPAVKLFSMSGVSGMYVHTDMTYVLIYGGIPYIMPVHRSLDGIDAHDAAFAEGVNHLIAQISNSDFNHVVSLGYVDESVNVNEYVLNWAKQSPMFDSADIDPSLVKMSIKNGTISPMGSLYLPGGYLYDIYAIEPILSRTLRPYRDFTQPSEVHAGREIVLVGGNPDIVYVGSQPSPNGFLYDVWVPNDARYYNRARQAVCEGRIPMGSFYIDDEDYIKSYSLLLKILNELDEEVNGPADEDDIPDVIVEQDDTETDEVPVLIELPEYLR